MNSVGMEYHWRFVIDYTSKAAMINLLQTFVHEKNRIDTTHQTVSEMKTFIEENAKEFFEEEYVPMDETGSDSKKEKSKEEKEFEAAKQEIEAAEAKEHDPEDLLKRLNDCTIKNGHLFGDTNIQEDIHHYLEFKDKLSIAKFMKYHDDFFKMDDLYKQKFLPTQEKIKTIKK